MSDFDSYRELIPQALSWLESVQQRCMDNGRALSPSESLDAFSVGVQSPEKIRILEVVKVSQPVDSLLMRAAVETGLSGESASGRTIGYGIEVVEGTVTRRLLRHEFRHVHQFENAGSLEKFITAYIRSVLSDGYIDSEYEKDARAYEQNLGD